MADLESLLSQIDLIDLAERAGAKFRHQQGRDARSACPLHGGDNATAFSVADGDGRQYWRCYTRCDAGGDAISFYQRWKGVDFPQAVRDLAEMYHVSLDQIGWGQARDLQAEHEQRRRQDVLDEAARFFASQLQLTGDSGALSDSRSAALAYVVSRGFSADAIRQAGWGYSASDQALARHLSSHKFDMELARQVGLIRSDGNDFTANGSGREAAPHGYLIFPHRYGNRTVYLSSRAVEIHGQPRPDPKDKSRNLPGPRQVYWAHVAGCESLVIVEGVADAETLRQCGQSALALCGLGEMPEADLARVKRREQIYLSVDSDAAGLEKLIALDSSVTRLADEIGPLLRIVTPSGDKDWNAWLMDHPGCDDDDLRDSLRAALANSRTWFDMRLTFARACADPLEIDERMCQIGGLLAKLPMAIQMRYARQAAQQLGVTLADVRRLITQASNNGNGNGKLSSVRDGRICFLGETLANFSPSITHELILDDGENTPICHYTVTGRLDSGEPLEAVDVAAEEFPMMNWVSRHWGARAIIHIPKGRYNVLARATQEISLESLARERVYQFTGWTTIDGKRTFLSASGALYADQLDPSVRVDLGGNNLRHYNLPAPAQGAELAQAVTASLEFLSLADRKVTAPLWAAIYAAPLTTVRSLNAVMWVYGPTQSGKSTVSHLALAHYGQNFISGREYHAPVDWTSTGTALEGALFRTKDVCLVIDDFAPQFTSKSEALSMHKKAHLIARSVGNRSARGRARADLTEQVTRVPRGLCIATAENPLMGQSVVGRMIYVTVEHGQVMAAGQNGLLDAAQTQAQAGRYAQAMTAYLQWLAQNWQRAADLFQEIIEESSRYARAGGKLQNRLPDYYGVLDAAQQIALLAFYELGYISEHQRTQYSYDNSEAILAVIAGQAEKIALESPVRKFLEALSSLLARERVYLSPRTKTEVEYYPPERAELIGWFEPFDTSVIYLDPEVCLQHAKIYWRDLDENLDILPDALVRQLAQVGLLKERGADSRLKVSKWIGCKTRWVLSLDADRARNLYGVDLSNENKKAVNDETQ